MDNQNGFYSPPHANSIKFLPHELKSGCNRAGLLIEGLFCTKKGIGKRVQVGGALRGEGLDLLDVLVAGLGDSPGPAILRAIARRHGHAGEPTQQPPPTVDKRTQTEALANFLMGIYVSLNLK